MSIDERARTWSKAAAGTALGCVAAVTLMVVLAGHGSRGSGDAGPRRLGGRTELELRSASLVVSDLAQSWDEQHYQTEPFEFCGLKELSVRQTKICADHFLSEVSNDKHNITNGAPLHGLPDLNVYSHCFAAKNYFQVKACVRLVSRSLTLKDFRTLQRVGEIHHSGELTKIAEDAVRDAQPGDSVTGLNGGLGPEIGEMSTADYNMKLDAVGNPPKGGGGCEQLGVGGCRIDGGLNPEVRGKALRDLGLEPNLEKAVQDS